MLVIRFIHQIVLYRLKKKSRLLGIFDRSEDKLLYGKMRMNYILKERSPTNVHRGYYVIARSIKLKVLNWQSSKCLGNRGEWDTFGEQKRNTQRWNLGW